MFSVLSGVTRKALAVERRVTRKALAVERRGDPEGISGISDTNHEFFTVFGNVLVLGAGKKGRGRKGEIQQGGAPDEGAFLRTQRTHLEIATTSTLYQQQQLLQQQQQQQPQFGDKPIMSVMRHLDRYSRFIFGH
jgi:hypothetical protein